MTEQDKIIKAASLKCPYDMEGLKTFRNQVRNAALALVGRPPFDNPPPLNSQVLEEVDCGSYVRKKVRYGNESDDVVWAWLLIPKKTKKHNPAIICLPGTYMTPNWGKDATVGLAGPFVEGDPESYGADLAKQGYITLCPDYPCAGERVRAGLKPYDTTDLDRRFPDWTRVGMSLWDVSRAADYLLTLTQVDPKQIGCTGLSQGGEMTIWATAMDDRISVAVSVCGLFPWNGRNPQNLCASYNYPRLKTYVDTDTTVPFSIEHLAAMIAPKPLLIASGMTDHYIHSQTDLAEAEKGIKQLYEMLGDGEQFKAFHMDHGHRYSSQAARVSLAWFHRWLRCTS